MVASVGFQEVMQTIVSGIALGSSYALVALGFVVVLKATGVLNLAQGGMVMLGAYLTYQFGALWALPFALAVTGAAVVSGMLAATLERGVIRPLAFRHEAPVIMVTVAVLFVIQSVVTAIWGQDFHNLGDPWGLRTLDVFGLSVAVKDLWSIGITATLVAAFFAFFQYTRIGLAMRATANDPEAALSQGVSSNAVRMLAWGLGGAAAGVAGAMLATGSLGVQPGLLLVAFAALPALLLGGIDSPVGAVVGGILIGVIQQLTALLQPTYLPALGDNFHIVTPYIVLVAVLIARPDGLFGTARVERF